VVLGNLTTQAALAAGRGMASAIGDDTKIALPGSIRPRTRFATVK
jgi:hypothetical protein